VNLALGVAFAGILVAGVVIDSGFVSRAGLRGISINFLLAGFNMIPFGPLDGRTVLDWSRGYYALVAVPSILLAVGALLVGPGF
jgi:Zn-dependent protease